MRRDSKIGKKWLNLCRKNKFADWIDDNIIWYVYDKPKSGYLTVKHWFYSNWNKYHWNLLKTAFTSYGWDYSFGLRLELAQIEKQLYWFEHQKYFTTDKQELVVRTLKLAKYFLGIMLDDNMLWTSSGSFEEVENEDGTYTIDGGTYKHHYIGPYVNQKNYYRFMNPKWFESIKNTEHLEDLYREKCKYLYYKIKRQYSEYWWD